MREDGVPVIEFEGVFEYDDGEGHGLIGVAFGVRNRAGDRQGVLGGAGGMDKFRRVDGCLIGVVGIRWSDGEVLTRADGLFGGLTSRSDCGLEGGSLSESCVSEASDGLSSVVSDISSPETITSMWCRGIVVERGERHGLGDGLTINQLRACIFI